MWAFKTLYDKGLVYEGFRVLPYCWRCETPLSNTETRMDDVYRDRQDPALTVWFELDDEPASRRCWSLDHHAVDAAVQPGPRRRPRHRLRGAREATASGYVLGDGRGSATTPRSCEGRRRSARVKGARAGRPPLHAAVRLLRRAGRAERVPGARPATSSPPRTAPASCTSRPAFGEDDQTRLQRGRHPDRRDRSTSTAGSPRWCRRTQGMQVFEANKPIIRDLKDAGVVRAPRRPTTTLYPHCWRCDTPLIYKAVSSLVRRGDRVPRPDGRAQPADHLGARARQGRLVRQVAGERPRLVDQPQPVLGLADPGVEVATTRRTRASTSTARSTSSSATSACGRPTCTGRTSTS